MNTLLKKLFTLTTFSLALLPAQNAVHAQCKNSIDENIYKELPFNMPKVEQPSFPDYTVSILQFGAKSDGTTLNTKAINDAIKAVNAKGGGKVVIPEGLWLTGPIELLSNVNLHTEKNALVVFTDDFNAYPILETSFEGLNTRRCQSPISAHNAENIAITGYGVFDGSGDSWRPVKKQTDCRPMGCTRQVGRCSRQVHMVSHSRIAKGSIGLQELQQSRRYRNRRGME